MVLVPNGIPNRETATGNSQDISCSLSILPTLGSSDSRTTLKNSDFHAHQTLVHSLTAAGTCVYQQAAFGLHQQLYNPVLRAREFRNLCPGGGL